MENRVLENIKTGIKKGENFFVFYGDYIHDMYLYDLYYGICDMKETLKRYFLLENVSDSFFYCCEGGFEAYKKDQTGKIIECTSEIVSGKVNKNSASNGMSMSNASKNAADSSNGQPDKTVKEATDNSGASGESATFQKVVQYCKNNKKEKISFYFEDYEWTTGMYCSSNDEKLDYIKNVKKLAALENVYIILSLEEVEMLKKYHFSVDGKNIFLLGSPIAEEVFSSFLRIYIKKYIPRYRIKKTAFTYKLFRNLWDISEAVASGEKSLNEVLRIFEYKMVQTKGKIDPADFQDTLDKEIEEKVFLDDVVLDDTIKKRIVDKVDGFLNAQNVSEVTKGMILTGPPGTGKTYLVKALANEKNCFFMSASLADLKAEYVGQSAPKIKRIFQQARANAPTILFIDEADTVFPSRDQGGNDSDSFTRDMVNQFLVEMDGMLTGESRVFVVAATNRIGVLDNAIKSRLGKPIEIPLPNKNERKILLNKLLSRNKMNIDSFIFMDDFLDKTNHMSGRDIKDFVDNLRREAGRQGHSLSYYKEEEETRELFYDCLDIYENALVKKLEDGLGIIIKEPDQSIMFKDIIGCKNIKNAIERQVAVFDRAKLREAMEFGVEIKRGILLYGPPGNGKSKLAEAAANEYGLYFMKVTSDTFTKNSLSEQNRFLTQIFNSALQLSEMCGEDIKGVLLFFDEFDSLASYDVLDRRVRGTMLTQLDDKNTMRNPETKILFMAATNFLGNLDEAIIRPGRIDERLEMKNPSKSEGKDMLRQFCAEKHKVDILSDDILEMAYSMYLESYRKNKMRFLVESSDFLENGVLHGFNDISDELRKKYKDYIKKNVFPSGADLRNYSNRLIEEAYYQNSFIYHQISSDDDDNNDRKEKLLDINEEVIKKVAESEENGQHE